MAQPFSVDAELFQALVNYLATRPYREVAGMMAPLMACKPIPEATIEASDGIQA